MQTREYKANQAAFRGSGTGDHGIKQAWGSGFASSTEGIVPNGYLVDDDGTPLIDDDGFYITE